MRRLIHEQDGSVVVAIVALTLMLVLGFATYAAVGTQTRLSSKERVRESAFNLSEGTLSAQTFVIGRLGPGNLSTEYPEQCPSQAEPTLCPDPDRLAESFDPALQADYAGGQTSWTTTVRDNGLGHFYDASVESQPRYDANGDNKMWVRASATVRGRTRTLVALVQVESRPVQFPRYTLLAGSFSTSNSGRHVLVDTSGSLGLAVRCATPPESDCLDYEVNKGQVSPNNYQLGYPSQTAISPDDLAGLEELAQANGTYYTSCPDNPSGAVVVVEGPDACEYNNSVPGACCNSAEAPGIFIVKNGTFFLNGNLDFHGIVYALNQQGSTGDVVKLLGTGEIRGGVMVDGSGGVSVGASGGNVVFDPRPFDGARSFGTAGIVQNTWRELTR